MLFVFRGMRLFQALAAVGTLGSGIGATLLVKAYGDGGGLLLIVGAVPLGLVFFWLFATTLRAPTSFLAVSDDRTRIRFAGFVDTVVPNADIAGVRLVRHRLYGGLGVRTNFGGDVALVTATGMVAELTLRRPVKVWLLPGLVRVRARRLRLSIKNPEKLAARFGQPPSRSPEPARKMSRRGS